MIQEPYLITKLESAEKTWKELSVSKFALKKNNNLIFNRREVFVFSFFFLIVQVKLGDPDVVSNPSEYQKLAQSVSELDEVYPISLLFFFF